jgi:hypothetical protein
MVMVEKSTTLCTRCINYTFQSQLAETQPNNSVLLALQSYLKCYKLKSAAVVHLFPWCPKYVLYYIIVNLSWDDFDLYMY